MKNAIRANSLLSPVNEIFGIISSPEAKKYYLTIDCPAVVMVDIRSMFKHQTAVPGHATSVLINREYFLPIDLTIIIDYLNKQEVRPILVDDLVDLNARLWNLLNVCYDHLPKVIVRQVIVRPERSSVLLTKPTLRGKTVQTVRHSSQAYRFVANFFDYDYLENLDLTYPWLDKEVKRLYEISRTPLVKLNIKHSQIAQAIMTLVEKKNQSR